MSTGFSTSDNDSDGSGSTWSRVSAWYSKRKDKSAHPDKYLLNGTVDVDDLSRKELVANLRVRGLSVEGKKIALRERLMEAIRRKQEEEQQHVARLAAKQRAEVTLEESGSVYAVGINYAGQLGLGDLSPREFFTVIPELRGKSVDLVRAGPDYCFAISEDSEVYAWGGGGHAPLGIVDEVVDEEDEYMKLIRPLHLQPWKGPRQVTRLRGEGIVELTPGPMHVLALSDGGDIFAWGDGGRGQLGIGHVRPTDTPELITALEDAFVIQATTGHSHSACVTDDMTLYTWGCTHRGRLGLGTTKREGVPDAVSRFFPSPTLVPSLRRVKVRQVACGASHCVALANNQQAVYSWGCGDGGRLGLGDNVDRLEPTPIAEFHGEVIVQVAAANWHSAAIVLIPPMLHGGLLYTWGSGYQGQLGQGKRVVAPRPARVEGLESKALLVKSIACGASHCAVLTDDDQVYTWGSNKFGCLGAEIDVEYTAEPQKVWAFDVMMDGVGRGTPRSVTCGKEFTIVACYPYTGPTEDELIEDEKRAVHEAEQQAIRDAEAKIQQVTQARKQEAQAKQLAKQLEAQKRPLCTICTTCKGFDPNLFKPGICKTCNHPKDKHTRRPEG